MMECSTNNTFIAFRVSCIILIAIALVLQGISLKKDARWDQYVTGAVQADIRNPKVYQIKAYQSLWRLTVKSDEYLDEDYRVYVDEYTSKTEWREEVLRLELAGMGLGSLSFSALVMASLVPKFLKIKKLQITDILGCTILCFTSAILIFSGVVKYSENYQTILNPIVKEYEWFYHMTDNTLAMDFYFAFGAAIFHFFGGVSLIIHLIMFMRSGFKKDETKVETIEVQELA
ncbi:uncharacterized protein LOC133171866 [Saccostrea echinata]|uniref:uncharacterized protein LOC133171866 n=1 Tax=Saccostrea echinata TaxID=191078 RepID=UPI002A835189|nr:uncharacterized protein LOC133171866 [Saccostrea echinata]